MTDLSGREMARLAADMTEEEAADILTWTDEPELLAQPGERAPTFPPHLVAAARIKSAWRGADFGRRSIN